MSAAITGVQIIICSACFGVIVAARLSNRRDLVAMALLVAGLAFLGTIVGEPLFARIADAAARSLALS